MSGISRISATRTLEGDEAARKLILDAIVQHQGSKQLAAEQLDVKKTTLYRTIDELGLWDRIDQVCKENGFPVRAGRPRGPVTEQVRRKIRRGRQAVLKR